MKGSTGTGIIQLVGVTLISLMVSSLGVDFAWYFAAQNQLQTAADAGALAAIHKLFDGTAPSASARQQAAITVAQNFVAQNTTQGVALDSQDVTFGYVDPSTKRANLNTFTTASSSSGLSHTGGYNAIKVAVHRDAGHTGGAMPTVFAQLFDFDTMDAAAFAIAMADNRIGQVNSGVRPIYACESQWLLAKAALDAGNTSPRVRIYGDNFQIQQQGQWRNVAGCPSPGSGNWGFADLRDCNNGSVGASTVGQWFANGYPGSVTVGQCYSTKPGNFIASGPVNSALNGLISNQTEVLVPVVPANAFRGKGSNTQVTPSAFVGFVFTGYQATGNQNGRYIEGYYTRKVCSSGQCEPRETATAGGVSVLRLVGTQ
jgi:hypothetical protein